MDEQSALFKDFIIQREVQQFLFCPSLFQDIFICNSYGLAALPAGNPEFKNDLEIIKRDMRDLQIIFKFRVSGGESCETRNLKMIWRS